MAELTKIDLGTNTKGTLPLSRISDADKLVKNDGSTPLTGDLNMNGHQLKELAYPSDPGDAVPLTLLDALRNTVTALSNTITAVSAARASGDASLSGSLAILSDSLATLATHIPTGGSTGQVLTKNSSSDYAYSWVTPLTGSGSVDLTRTIFGDTSDSKTVLIGSGSDLSSSNLPSGFYTANGANVSNCPTTGSIYNIIIPHKEDGSGGSTYRQYLAFDVDHPDKIYTNGYVSGSGLGSWKQIPVADHPEHYLRGGSQGLTSTGNAYPRAINLGTGTTAYRTNLPSGFYSVYNCADMPDTGWWYLYINHHDNATTDSGFLRAEIAIDYDTAALYTRTWSDSTTHTAWVNSGGGGISLSNNVWLTSTTDGKNRFYFGANGNTYFGSNSRYVFRSAGDTNDYLTIFDSGNVQIATIIGNDAAALTSAKLYVDGVIQSSGIISGSNTPVVDSPGARWLPYNRIDNKLDWCVPIGLPSLVNVSTTGGWDTATSLGTGYDSTKSINTQGMDYCFRIFPNSTASDGFLFRTGGSFYTAPAQRTVIIGTISVTGTLDSSNGIDGGFGFVNGNPASGQSTPPAGSNAAVIYLDRDSSTGVPGLYAFSMRSGTIVKTLLTTVTTGTLYTGIIQLETNGSVTYQISGGPAYTNTSSNTPVSTARLAVGAWARRTAGSGSIGLNIHDLNLYRSRN